MPLRQWHSLDVYIRYGPSHSSHSSTLLWSLLVLLLFQRHRHCVRIAVFGWLLLLLLLFSALQSGFAPYDLPSPSQSLPITPPRATMTADMHRSCVMFEGAGGKDSSGAVAAERTGPAPGRREPRQRKKAADKRPEMLLQIRALRPVWRPPF